MASASHEALRIQTWWNKLVKWDTINPVHQETHWWAGYNWAYQGHFYQQCRNYIRRQSIADIASPAICKKPSRETRLQWGTTFSRMALGIQGIYYHSSSPCPDGPTSRLVAYFPTGKKGCTSAASKPEMCSIESGPSPNFYRALATNWWSSLKKRERNL